MAPYTLQSASARAITIPTGVDLQTYLNNAQPGDTLILPAGAVYTGNFTLPNKSARNGLRSLLRGSPISLLALA